MLLTPNAVRSVIAVLTARLGIAILAVEPEVVEQRLQSVAGP